MHLGLQSPDTNPSEEFINNMGPPHKELSLDVNATSLLLEKIQQFTFVPMLHT